MLSEAMVRAMLAWHEHSLAGWSEDGGFLLPTEPCPETRSMIRAQLRAVIHVLRLVVDDIPANTRDAEQHAD